MKKIESEIIIDADISTVWSVLTDFEKYPDWNPFIHSIKGEKAVGHYLTVSINLLNGNKMTFKPIILKLEARQELRWRGRLGTKIIFQGEHFFILEEINKTQTKFIHGENFSGLLTLLMKNVFEKTKKGFVLMNQSIKKECENRQ